ncbi:MAG: hypothetical protein ACLUIQ_03275 [Dialister invisus]
MANSDSQWIGVVDNSGSDQAGEVNLAAEWSRMETQLSIADQWASGRKNAPTERIPYGKYDGYPMNQLVGGNSPIRQASFILKKYRNPRDEL